MTFTYASSGLSSSTLYQVRFLIGDTDSNDGQLQDEEINFLISNEGSVQAAAIAAAESILAELARFVDKTVGPFSESLSQRIAQYEKLIASLRRKQVVSASPYAGGISISNKNTRIADADRVRPAFGVGMMNNPQSNFNGSSS